MNTAADFKIISDYIESLIKRTHIGIITTTNGTDHELIDQLVNLKKLVASQFKTVEKRAELLKQMMDTDQEYGIYEHVNKCDHRSLLWIDSHWKYLCLECGLLKITREHPYNSND